MKAIGTMLTAAAAALALAGCEGKVELSKGLDEDNAAGAEAPGTAAGAAGAQPLVRTAGDPELQWGPCPDIFPEGCETAVLQGDPARPNADLLLRVPGGQAIPPHTHASAERMVLVEGVLAVKYQGAPVTLLREGSYAYGPAGRPHRAECRSSGPCVLFIAFEQPVDAKPFEGEIE